ncbi:MAG: hypothetical protein ABIH23_15950 [bacterium]
MKRNVCWYLIASFVCLFGFYGETGAQTSELDVVYSASSPMGIVGSFYTEAGSSPSIESVRSWGSYLYLTVRYVNGDQKLEVWDVRDPLNPVMTQSLDFGNLVQNPQNHYKLPYVNVFDDVIIVRSDLLDYLYQHDNTGQLIQTAVHDFGTTVGEILNREMSFHMSSAASYGTFFGRLFEPYEVMPEEEYGYVILNFTNPRRPFVSTTIPPKTVEQLTSQFPGHLNAALGNYPGVITASENLVQLSLRKIKSDTHIDVFWEPRFPNIFNSDTLNRTIRSQISRIVRDQSYGDLFANAVERFFEDLELDAGSTVRQVIEEKYDAAVSLQSISDDYGIARDDSLRVAVQKIVSKNLTLELEKELSRALFSPALDDWLDDLFLLPTNVTRDDLVISVSNVLNDGLSADTVARFLLDKYIAPLAESPDTGWLSWTTDQLIDEVANSEAGQVVSAFIETAHDIVTAGDFLSKLLDYVPDGDRFPSLPDFPENCRDILEYVLYDGANLDPDGLAFMEMLKLYQYYSGDDDYSSYEIPFADAIRQLQGEMAGAVVETVEPFLASQTFAGGIRERIDIFSQGIPSRAPISLGVADAIVARLEAHGINADQTVREAFLDHQLYLDVTDIPILGGRDLAKVDDLIRVLDTDLQEAQTLIHDIWNEGKAYVEHVQSACYAALEAKLREAWGEIDLDVSIESALREFLGNHIDARWTFGENMDELLEQFVYSSLTEYPGFCDYLDLLKRANDGDGMAQWQFTIKAAKEAVALIDLTGTTTATYEMIELTLEEAFREALAGAMKTLLNEFSTIMMRDMFGSFSAWVSRTEPLNFSFNIDDFTSIQSVRNEAFAWEDRVGVIAREGWDYLNPRKMALVLFDPMSPENTKQEWVLDERWGGVDYVHFCRGVVMIGGTRYEGIWPSSTAMFLALDNNRILVNSIQDYRLAAVEGMTTVNHDAHLVLYGPGGVFLVSNPLAISARAPEKETGISKWMYH